MSLLVRNQIPLISQCQCSKSMNGSDKVKEKSVCGWGRKLEGKGTIPPPDRGPWARRGFGRCGPYLLSPSPLLTPPSPSFRREDRKLGIFHLFFQTTTKPQKSHVSSCSISRTSHILINILHEVLNHQHVAKQKIRKQVAKLFSSFSHISHTYIYIYILQKFCVCGNISPPRC